MPAPAPVRDPGPADAPAFSAARVVCRRHAKSFYVASAFLPRAKRDAAYAVYSYCRMIDDAVDAGPTGDDLEARLAGFRDRLDNVYAGRLDIPAVAERTEAQHALRAFELTVRRYGIPQRYFLDLADGCRMDLTVSRYETWADLERYCYLVAGVVGLVMCRVFGVDDPSAGAKAVTMGNAMQLTNILRDVNEDWERGRVYLPQEDLRRFGYGEQDLARGVADERFRELMKFQIARARRLYREAADGLQHLPADGSRLTACAMAVIYSGILGAIERQRFDVFSRRAHLTTAQKLRRLPAAWRLARRRPGQPVPGVFD